MSDKMLDWLYAPLKKYGLYEDFLKWAKQENLLPKKKMFKKCDSNEEIRMVIQAIVKYAETHIDSEEMKYEICRYRP